MEERKQVERHQQDYDQFADAVETQVDDVRTMVELLARDVVQRVNQMSAAGNREVPPPPRA